MANAPGAEAIRDAVRDRALRRGGERGALVRPIAERDREVVGAQRSRAAVRAVGDRREPTRAEAGAKVIVGQRLGADAGRAKGDRRAQGERQGG